MAPLIAYDKILIVGHLNPDESRNWPTDSDEEAMFLDTADPMTDEYHVVYFMVEARKILDHEGSNGSYPLLKFYADWAVHIQKDYVSKVMHDVIEDMYRAAIQHIAKPAMVPTMSPVMQFAYMDALGQDVRKFLEDHGLDASLTTEKDEWVGFVQLLIKVLEDQPIIAPTKDVKSFRFEPAAPGCVIGILEFNQPFLGEPGYNFGNAF